MFQVGCVQSMLIFSIPNHPFSFMVYYYLFGVFLSQYYFQASFNWKICFFTGAKSLNMSLWAPSKLSNYHKHWWISHTFLLKSFLKICNLSINFGLPARVYSNCSFHCFKVKAILFAYRNVKAKSFSVGISFQNFVDKKVRNPSFCCLL